LGIYNYYLIDLANINNSMERFLPTLLQIVLLIKNITFFSLFITLLLTFSTYFNFFNISFYIKYRLQVLFLALILFTLLLPPDFFVLLLSTCIIFAFFESFLFIFKLLFFYNKKIFTLISPLSI